METASRPERASPDSKGAERNKVPLYRFLSTGISVARDSRPPDSRPPDSRFPDSRPPECGYPDPKSVARDSRPPDSRPPDERVVRQIRNPLPETLDPQTVDPQILDPQILDSQNAFSSDAKLVVRDL